MKGFNKNEIDTGVYHFPCPDGLASVWVAQQYLGDKIELIGVHPDDAPPDLKGKNVLMVDISWSRAETEKMHDEAKSLLILDHHVTAEKELEGLDYAVFDMERSGCMMAWDYFYPDKKIPTFVQYIGLGDIWKHKGTDAELFLAAFPKNPTFEDFDKYNDDKMVQECVEKGKMALEKYELEVGELAIDAIRGTWKGHDVLFVEATYPWISGLGDFLTRGKNAHVVAMIWNKKDDTTFAVSLRSNSKTGPDVSILAESMNGGGHAHAAGFRTKESPEKLLE